MKYFITFFVFIFLLSGCCSTDRDTSDKDATPVTSPAISKDNDFLITPEFKAYYCRTDSAFELTGMSDIKVYKTVESLNFYADKVGSKDYKTAFDENVASPMKLADINKFDKDYFQDNALIIVRITEPSGSIRHNVAAVETVNNTTTVHIERIIPLCGTDDMANWHIIIEIPSSDVSDNVKLMLYDYNRDIDMLTITSGNMTYYNLYHRSYRSASYTPEYDNILFADPGPFDPAEVLEDLTSVEWNDNFEINIYQRCKISEFRIYNDTLTDYKGQTESLDISQFDKPGTYPIRFVANWTLGTRYGSDRPDTVSEEYIFLLIIEAEDLQ